MTVPYDKYYQTRNLFGEPYPELIDFFTKNLTKGKVLDIGCGQGRDSIPLARLGFNVTGIDVSKVGIEELKRIAQIEKIPLVGMVMNMYDFQGFEEFDFIILNSMFHFTKRDRDKEVKFIQRVVSRIRKGCLLVFCVQDVEKKIEILNQALDFDRKLNRIGDKKFNYEFEDNETGHHSKTKYRMIVVEK